MKVGLRLDSEAGTLGLPLAEVGAAAEEGDPRPGECECDDLDFMLERLDRDDDMGRGGVDGVTPLTSSIEGRRLVAGPLGAVSGGAPLMPSIFRTCGSPVRFLDCPRYLTKPDVSG